MLRMFIRTSRTVDAFRYYNKDFAINTSTIYALSSGQGKCGVAVVRVSGTGASYALMQLMKWKSYPKPRYAHLKFVHSPITNEIIDRALVLWFPGPRSFTGEDVCEFHVHGGPAVISALLEALSCLPNFRLARPGEFSKRAFQNGKMDLVEVEGLADLIHAETEFQRQQAFLQAHGRLSAIYIDWRDKIYGLLARFETLFNFDLEEQEDMDSLPQIARETLLIYNDINKHLDDGKCGERLRSGVDVVIAGEPNVGKSSLYNALCKRSAAIVTPYPGTTRDVLDVHLDVAGYPVTLYDTCGIHVDPSIHPIEAQGIAGAKQAVTNAQLLILMIDATKFNTWRENNKTQPITVYLERYLHKIQMTELMDRERCIIREFIKKPCVVVFNKCDQLTKPLDEIDFEGAIPISVTENLGMKELEKKITAQVKSLYSVPGLEDPIITHARHRALLQACCEKLKCFADEGLVVETEETIFRDYAIMGDHLREAIKCIVEIIEGKVPNDPVFDVLDDIFANFCIGK